MVKAAPLGLPKANGPLHRRPNLLERAVEAPLFRGLWVEVRNDEDSFETVARIPQEETFLGTLAQVRAESTSIPNKAIQGISLNGLNIIYKET